MLPGVLALNSVCTCLECAFLSESSGDAWNKHMHPWLILCRNLLPAKSRFAVVIHLLPHEHNTLSLPGAWHKHVNAQLIICKQLLLSKLRFAFSLTNDLNQGTCVVIRIPWFPCGSIYLYYSRESNDISQVWKSWLQKWYARCVGFWYWVITP